MFRRLGIAVSRHPWRVISAWAVVGIALALFGQARLYNVTTSDQKDLLSKSYESVKAQELGERAFGHVEGTTAVTALVKRADGGPLQASDRRRIARLTGGTTTFEPDWDEIGSDVPFLTGKRKQARVVDATVGPTSPDGRLALAALSFKGNASDPATQEAFKQFRDETMDAFRAERLSVGFTGGVASITDDVEEGEAAQLWETILLYGGIVLLTLVFFRAILAAVVPLLAVVIVGGAASGLVVLMASVLDQKLESSTPSLITVVLMGIGIDYFLFLLFRYRERLRAGESRKEAAASSVARVGGVIASAALAIVVAFATLAVAEFGQFRMLGPSIALAVLVMLFAGITLFPALLAVSGRAMFWPSRSWQRERPDGPAARLGALVARRPMAVATATVALLAVLAIGVAGSKTAFDVGGSQADTAANRVADEVAASLPRGATDPVQIYVDSDARLTASAFEPMRRSLAGVDGVGLVAQPVFAPGGRVAQIDVSLRGKPAAEESMDVVRNELSSAATAAAPPGSEVLIGGTSAVFADVRQSVDRDLRLIFPLAGGLILLILVALLRAAVAPLYMIAAVVLEFAATLGAAALLFQHGLDRDGISFSLPIVLFLFVVAIGTDYNMLIASRLREEAEAGRPAREATATALRFAAPPIAAAGLVLATAFSSLMFKADETSKQMGFAMAVGILLASLVVSTLLVPAVTRLVGDRAWWPGRRAGARTETTSAWPARESA